MRAIAQRPGAYGFSKPAAGGGGGSPLPAQELIADGIWTWYTDPRAIYHAATNATYIMAVDSAGTCFCNRYLHASGTVESFRVSSVALEADDHDNGSLYFVSDTVLAAFYGIHNDTVFRYRVCSNLSAFTSSGSWSSEAQRGTSQGPYSYPNLARFSIVSSPLHWYFYRRWIEGSGTTRTLAYRNTTAMTGSSDPWSAHSEIWRNTGFIPYWKLAFDGVSKVHIFPTDMHPVQGQSSLYHFYMEVDSSGVPSFKKSDGTPCSGSAPFGPANVTQIYDGTATKSWVGDATIDSDGNPRVLWMRYPGNNGSAIEIWHSRWTGSAWSSVKIADDGPGLYSPEVYYHGGCGFDSMDANRVALSIPVSGVRQVREFTSSDNGATWNVSRTLTSGGTAGNPLRLRPYSPRNHNGQLRWVWNEGIYTNFNVYDTAVWGAG